MRRVSLKALLISSVVMLALDTVGGIIMTILFGRESFQEGMTPQQTQAALEAINQSNGFLLAGLAYGTTTTIVGGYLAARLAKTFPYFNAAAFGLVGIALSVLLASDSPLWFTSIGLLSTLPAALFGGHLARRRDSPSA
jgi:hypothetical protein